MQIHQLLAPARIACSGQASSKKRVLENLADLLAQGSDQALDATEIFDSLLGRERLGSTGLGHGIALPHGRMPYHGPPLAAFVTLKNGVDFDALDGEPVRMLFALVIPEESTDEHLQILANLARMFSDGGFREQLMECGAPEDALKAFAHWAPQEP
ncbi:MAG: PTS sugar transporter subunit IIA [Gammaproteobacteria bacterium]